MYSPYTEGLERLRGRQERNDQFTLPPSFKDIESKEGNAIGLPMSQIFPQILCLQSGHPHVLKSGSLSNYDGDDEDNFKKQ